MTCIRKFTDDDLKIAVSKSKSIRQVLIYLGLSDYGGGNYYTIKRHIERLQLDISHFLGQAHYRGSTHGPTCGRSLSNILVEHSTHTNMFSLKNRLIKEGLLDLVCNICFNTTWMNKPIPLEMHHKNGIKDDLRIENLELICPNCHALSDYYRGCNMSGSQFNNIGICSGK